MPKGIYNRKPRTETVVNGEGVQPVRKRTRQGRRANMPKYLYIRVPYIIEDVFIGGANLQNVKTFKSLV